MELFPDIPEDFAALSDEDLARFAEETAAAIQKVTAAPSEFVSDDVSSADLLTATKASAEALRAAREELSTRAASAADVEENEDSDETVSDEFAALADEFATEDPEDDADEDDAPEDGDDVETAAIENEDAPEPKEAVTAAAKPKRQHLPAPSRSRRVQETKPQEQERVALTAAAGAAPNHNIGSELTESDIAMAMIDRRRRMGVVAAGTEGDRIPIARADWSGLYPDDRKLTNDEVENLAIVENALRQDDMKAELSRRKEKALVASGGLCAPVTPYYQLQMISQADRPVRAALAAFNADRGGIRYARPAALSVIGTGVGYITEANDRAGGTLAHKSCQVVTCPDWQETDVATIYHCLQFGNLGARTFPERVTQWNQLTLAAHARLAEANLLNGIDDASTDVTAGTLGLGATASFMGQILALASGMRSRHRMATDSVLRLLLPWWAPALMVSDVIRSQFERFDTDEAKITALLRSFNIEPSYYIDSADGRNQIFGAQGAHQLLEFPSTLVAYMYPEGSFLYIDGGTLELGLVRDSVLNSTNDFQIFGETFENVAFVGVESISLLASVCDSGVVAGTHNAGCPIDYSHVS